VEFPVVLMVLTLLISAAPADAGFKDGLAAFKKKDYKAAFTEWEPLAQKGHTLAQNNLAIMYRRGYGVDKDDLQAMKWYLRAANRGLAKAQYSLGLFYEKGRGGLPKNVTAAVNLYMQAAGGGYPFAQFTLANRLENGKGAERDLIEAMAWYISAAGTSRGKLRVKSVKARDRLKESLTQNEVEMAENFAEEWTREYRRSKKNRN
jgi:uncharacterized protein